MQPHELARKLTEFQHESGGFGYRRDSSPQAEPTALALLALSSRPDYQNDVARGRDWLLSIQDASGCFRVLDGYSKSVWPTSVSLLSLIRLAGPVTAISKGISWLLHLESKTSNKDAEQIQLNVGIDPTLVGWGWTVGTFAWVDPTAWACLALRHAGLVEHPRVQTGLKLLLNRAYDEGGANCGNRHVYGSKTEPVPANTASLLLAHAGLSNDNERLPAACRFLISQLRAHHDRYMMAQPNLHHDLENLAWSRIALEGYRHLEEVQKVIPTFDGEIERLLQEDLRDSSVFALNSVRLSLALLALNISVNNPFHVPATVRKITFTPLPAEAKEGLISKFGKAFKSFLATGVNQIRDLPLESKVHIAKAERYEESELLAVLQSQYSHFREMVPLKDKRVVLKPNFVEFHDNKVINTNPVFIGAVIALCKEYGAKQVIVAEGPGHWRNVRYLVEASGLGEVLKRHQVRFVDINTDNLQPLPNRGLLTGMEQIYFSETIASAEVLISLPKFKTHHWAGVTLSLKNLFGTLPGACYGWPKNELHWRGIDNSIVDIALSRTPDLAIVDGIIGMEGDGPLNGSAKEMGIILMGNDLLAVDATGARLMGLVPERMGHLYLAASRKLGRLDAAQIQQVGESIAFLKKPFKTPPKLEALSESVESKTVFVAGK